MTSPEEGGPVRSGGLANLDSVELRRALDGFGGRKVLVVGDLMVDEYVDGRPSKVSQEAPVPVIAVQDEWWGVGGAANVAHQIAVLGGEVALCGVVGADEAGAQLRLRCSEIGIDTTGIVTDDGRRTTRKLRVLGRGQQTVRVDFEDTAPVGGEVLRSLVSAVRDATGAHAVVLSDYGKGVVHPEVIGTAIEVAASVDGHCLVDPAVGSIDRYAGATVLKANADEFVAARQAAGLPARDASPATVAELFEASDAAALVVTLGERGALVADGRGEVVGVPALPIEVVDPAGAGDTAMAVLALALCSGMPLVDGVRVANLAAGAAVRRRGVAVISREEVLDVAAATTPTSGPMQAEQVAELAARWRDAARRVVMTNGCFDLLHPGHLHLLRSASAMGDVLVVAINSDRSVRQLKGPGRPVLPATDRAQLLGELRCVDAVVVFDEPTPLELIRAVRPDVLVKGDDYDVDEIVGAEDVISAGGSVATVPVLPGWSTSGLVAKEGRVAGA